MFDEIEKQNMRTKLHFMFRFMYDLGLILNNTLRDRKLLALLLTQILTAQVKIFHQTRNRKIVDVSSRPGKHVIKLGESLEATMNKLFDELEACADIVTPIHMHLRFAPIYEKHVEALLITIEKIYSEPESLIESPAVNGIAH